ncbi:hypothetical protein [Weissella coleopterorum]|uniref:hypothetical protein n=1 Tax=Weissella coleopterorum TaxID=2714949 RepID=UPI003CCD197F
MIQTILGSNGPIGHELALELYRKYTHNIRLVSRHPIRINSDDELVTADMTSYLEKGRPTINSCKFFLTQLLDTLNE